MIQWLEYTEKDSKEKKRAADVESVLLTMEELEAYNGSTERAIHQNWYEVKRQLRDVLLEPMPEEAKK